MGKVHRTSFTTVRMCSMCRCIGSIRVNISRIYNSLAVTIRERRWEKDSMSIFVGIFRRKHQERQDNL
jgi:hypothetical protein